MYVFDAAARCLTHHVIMVVQYHLQSIIVSPTREHTNNRRCNRVGEIIGLSIYLSIYQLFWLFPFHEIRIELFSWLSIKSSTMLFGIQARRYKTLLVFILFMVGLLKWSIYSTD
ncbi:hypothetical protein EE612_060171 [Oryza sativa]|nr:hypothetical protein EE612_060171 [Oryza sativa]